MVRHKRAAKKSKNKDGKLGEDRDYHIIAPLIRLENRLDQVINDLIEGPPLGPQGLPDVNGVLPPRVKLDMTRGWWESIIRRYLICTSKDPYGMLQILRKCFELGNVLDPDMTGATDIRPLSAFEDPIRCPSLLLN